MTIPTRLWQEMDLRDQHLRSRILLSGESRALTRFGWIAVTHAGGAIVTISSVLLPLLLRPWERAISWQVAWALLISHLLVQVVKRLVHRERPAATGYIRSPDRFSFPSGHATAALSVALGYSIAFPDLTLPLISFALLVGWSRVVLGVHYPGDVLVGQLIAVGTVIAIN